MIYLTNINLSQNELQNAVIQPLATAPANPKLGQIYCNSTSSRIMWYNGTAWVTVGVVVESSETNGKIKVDGVEMTVYELPIATGNKLGGIKIGTGFTIDADGKLHVAQANYYEVVRNDGESDTDAITRALGDSTPKNGDICVVKTLIATGKYSYIGFYYSNSWHALDGNVDAKNVYLTKDITITAPIGVHTIPSSGSKTLSSNGKNIEQFMEYLGAEEKNPSKTEPSVSITFSKAGAKEVGTSVTPSYSASLNAGSYTYGPATGITATAWSISDTDGNTASTASGSFPAITVGDNTNYKITAQATHGAGAIPVTNLGNEYPSMQIAAGNKSKTSGAITGFRSYFYGSKTAAITLNSANIRALTNSNKAVGNSQSFSMSIVEGAKQVIIAFPTSTGKTLSKVLDEGAFGTDIVGSFTKTTVSVEGANGYTAVDYDVYIYAPDAALGANTYKVTIA